MHVNVKLHFTTMCLSLEIQPLIMYQFYHALKQLVFLTLQNHLSAGEYYSASTET